MEVYMSTTKSPAKCFEACKKQILGIPDKEHAVMNMPYEEAMQEGRRVEVLVEKYGKQLAVSDIDPELLGSFPLLVGAFAFCVAALESSVENGDVDSEQFMALKKKGYARRRKLIADLRYIFRDLPDVLQVLDRISSGRGDLDMFKDLLSLYKLVVDHKDRLEKAHFNMEEAEEAYSLYNELFSLSAERDIVPQKISEAKSLVIKSWTLLWRSLEEIYAAGRYVFYDNPELEELFYGDYRQKIGAKNHKTVEEQPAAATPPEATTEPEEVSAS